VYASEPERLKAFAKLAANFLCGRWLRVWPTLQASVLLTLVWSVFLSGGDQLTEEEVQPCKVRKWEKKGLT
jgi:hypothetical protein